MSTSILSFAGKNVLVTGAANGFGKAISLKLASLGARLALVDIDDTGLRETSDQCSDASPGRLRPHVLTADLREEGDIKRAFDESLDELKRLNVLVNNVGIARLSKLRDTTILVHLDDMFRLNVRAPLYLSQLSSKALIETKGCIVNVSSIAGYKAAPMMLPYSMTKGAVTMMTKGLAVDLGRKGVRVNEVNPGPATTNIFKSMDGFTEDMEKATLQQFANYVPMRRNPDAEDVANAVAFLASDEAKIINGVSLFVDGGQVL